MDEGRRHFEAAMADDLNDLAPDYAELWTPAQLAVACAALGDRARAPRLHELIEPFADCFVDNGPSWCGAATHYLGLLAGALGELDEADARFAAAARSYERLGALAWLIRVDIDHAELLRSRARGGDLRRADELLREALRAARELDLPRIQSRIAAAQADAAHAR